MTEVLLEMAEEHFLANKYEEAYHTAKLAKRLDPFFPSIDRYEAAYRVHVAASRSSTTNSYHEPNWYEVLGGIEKTASTQAITHRFCRMGKQIDPNNHSSAAAKGAYALVTKAFEILGDYKSRSAFHYRLKLAPPKMEKETETLVRPTIRSCTVANNVVRVGHHGRYPPRSRPYVHHRGAIPKMVA